jgi:RNA polymerase sigma-70 factor, ECF subfamily
MLPDETNLVMEARRGNEQAFLTLYGRYRTALFRYVCRLTGSVALAEDATQECFLELLRGARFEADRGSLQSYLFGMARNWVFRRLRISERESEEEVESVSPADILGDLLASERAALVADAIASLSVFQREAIILFEYEELSLDEIANITGADVGAVKARLHRARDTLRKRLAALLVHDSERSCS